MKAFKPAYWMKKASQETIRQILLDRAEFHGGKCLSLADSEAVFDKQALLHWECQHGHRFYRTYPRVSMWCPQCAQANANKHEARMLDRRQALLRELLLERLRVAAAARGGACLDSAPKYQNAHYRFRCKLGHEWDDCADSVFKSSAAFWCPICRADKKPEEGRVACRNGRACFGPMNAKRYGI